MAYDSSTQDSNKALVRASFDRWRTGTGGPFELLAPEAEWTIVGSSPLSKTYQSRQEFLDQVINPFNARMGDAADSCRPEYLRRWRHRHHTV